MKSVYCAVGTGSVNKAVCASSLKVSERQHCMQKAKLKKYDAIRRFKATQKGKRTSLSLGESNSKHRKNKGYVLCEITERHQLIL